MAINYGSEVLFNDASTTGGEVTKLDSTHIAVAWDDAGSGDTYGHVRIGTLSGTDTITYGTDYTFISSNIRARNYFSISTLDSTHIVISYLINDTQGYSVIGVISSGTVVTFGTPVQFNANTARLSVTGIDATHFAVSYTDAGNSSKGTARIGVVSAGDTITYGSEYVYNADTNNTPKIATLDSTHVVVSYSAYEGVAWEGYSCVGVISSGNVITWGTQYEFNDVLSNELNVDTLDSTHFVISYKDGGNSNRGTAIVGVVSSGDTITFGSEYVYLTTSIQYPEVAILDSTHFVVVYKDAVGNTGGSKYGTVASDDEITYGSAQQFNASTDFIGAVGISDDSLVIAYQDGGNSDKGTSIMGVYSAVSGPANLKTLNGVAAASVKTVQGTAIASIKSINTVV